MINASLKLFSWMVVCFLLFIVIIERFAFLSNIIRKAIIQKTKDIKSRMFESTMYLVIIAVLMSGCSIYMIYFLFLV